MTRRATFTLAELTRAARAAQRLGMRVAVHLTDDGAKIELLPGLDAQPVPVPDTPSPGAEAGQW